jgi:hypothetical protein
MPLTLSPSVRYDMPANFGPSMVPDRTEIARAESLVLSGSTTQEAVAAIVPSHFVVPEQPTLTIAHMKYFDIDYMGGRSYNEIVVSVSASFVNGPGAPIEAPLAVALWVDQPGALIAGREFMGLPKILGFISDLEGDESEYRFTAGEYDAVLIAASAFDLSPIEGDRLSKLNERASEVRTFGWKYIAAPGGGSDLDYPLINTMRWSYGEAWSGTGEVAFIPPSFSDAPLSKAVVEGLARLPVDGPMRAFRGIGQATIDRAATRRLSSV